MTFNTQSDIGSLAQSGSLFSAGRLDLSIAGRGQLCPLDVHADLNRMNFCANHPGIPNQLTCAVKTYQTRNYRNRLKGFSLVELLTVIGVIAIFAAIALPWMVEDRDSAVESVARRNAQIIASVAGAARSAGVTAVDRAGSIPNASQLLIDGVPGKGAMSTTVFRISSISPDIIDEVKKYLEFTHGMLATKD